MKVFIQKGYYASSRLLVEEIQKKYQFSIWTDTEK